MPVDFSSAGEKAIQTAVELAARWDANILLLHVIDGNVQQCAVDYCLDQEVIDAIEQGSQKAARKKLEDEFSRWVGAKTVRGEIEVRSGRVFQEIIRAQQERGADWIVLSSHGRTGALKHLFGGVADKVLREAHCPVLVVK